MFETVTVTKDQNFAYSPRPSAPQLKFGQSLQNQRNNSS